MGLTYDQIRELHDCFVMFDSKNKGFIMMDQLREVLKCLGYNPMDKELHILQFTVDRDSNGRIEFPEFVELIEIVNASASHDLEALESFRSFDLDNEGFVNSQDLREALLKVMEKATDSEKEAAIAEFRLKENRRITFEEFKEMITIADNEAEAE